MLTGPIRPDSSDSRTRVSRPILTRVSLPWLNHALMVDSATPPKNEAADSTECSWSRSALFLCVMPMYPLFSLYP